MLMFRLKRILPFVLIATGLSSCNVPLLSQLASSPLPVMASVTLASSSHEDRHPPPATVVEPVTVAAEPGAEAPPPSGDLWQRIRRGFQLAGADHPNVQPDVLWFTGRQHYLDGVLDRAEPYLFHIVEAVEDRGLPMELVLLPIIESGFQPFAYSPGRASGIWQFVPGTGRRFGLKQDWWYDGRRDILEATRAALDYLEILHGRYDDWLLAIAAYNCGEGNLDKALGKNRKQGKPTDFWALDLPRETRAYLPRLLAITRVLNSPQSHGLSLRGLANEPQLAIVSTGSQIDLALAAELAGIPIDTVYRLNPAFNRWATDPDGPHQLLVPVARAESFRAALEELPVDQRVRWRRHKIRSGETLSTIAQRYHTETALIRQVNNLSGTLIRAGRHLLVPQARTRQEAYTLSATTRRERLRERAGRRGKGVRHDYTVRAGDSLWWIARRYQVSVKKLASWNGLSSRDTLAVGRKLVVWQSREVATGTPAVAGGTTRKIRYTVRSGESLWHISRRFNVSVASLREWNGLAKNKYLQPGQRLLVYVDVTRQSENI